MKIKRFKDVSFEGRLGDANLKFFKIWHEISGRFLSDRVSFKNVENDFLCLYVLSPVWTHHINSMKHDIMRSIYEKTGIKLKGIRCFNSTKNKKTILLDYNPVRKDVPNNIEYNTNLFNDVKDENIRKRLEKVAKESFIRQSCIEYEEDPRIS